MPEATDKLHALEMRVNTVEGELRGIRTSLDEKHDRSKERFAEFAARQDEKANVIKTVIQSADHGKQLLQMSADSIEMTGVIRAQNQRVTLLEEEVKELKAERKALARYIITSLITAIVSLGGIVFKFATG